MALGDPYVTLEELKKYVKLPLTPTDEDDRLTWAAAAATEKIERCCDRQFNKATTATTRMYAADSSVRVSVDDFYTTEDLVIETDGSIWATDDFDLYPANGILDGQPGWPFFELEAVSGLGFPIGGRRRRAVKVTARWGWEKIPAPVKQATLIIASQAWKLADAPHGVAGFGQFGEVRIKDIPLAGNLLAPYVREPIQVW